MMVESCLAASLVAYGVHGVPPERVIADALVNFRIETTPRFDQIGIWDDTQQRYLALPVEEMVQRLSSANRVHVCTHGWLPNAVDLVESFRGQEPPLSAWDDRLTVDGQPMLPNMSSFGRAFSLPASGAQVLCFSWVEDAAHRMPEEALARAKSNAVRLAATLNKLTPPAWRAKPGMVHLFGHSAGARLMAEAAALMDPPPEHLTLADGPELTLPPFFTPVNLNFLVLGDAMASGRIRIGRGPGQTFIDNYISAYGIPYGALSATNGVVDIRLQPPPDVDGHLYAEDWYVRAALAQVPHGPAWSPLLGSSTPAAPYFTQESMPDMTSGDRLREFSLTAQSPAARLATYVTDPGLVTVSVDGPAAVHPGPRLWQDGTASSIWTAVMNIDDPDKALTFEYLLESYTSETRVLVWVEDELRFISLLPNEEPGLLQSGISAKWQRAQVGLSNLGRGLKTIRIGMRGTGGTIRVEAFAKVSLPQINNAYRPHACGLIPPQALAATVFGAWLMERRRGRRRVRTALTLNP